MPTAEPKMSKSKISKFVPEVMFYDHVAADGSLVRQYPYWTTIGNTLIDAVAAAPGSSLYIVRFGERTAFDHVAYYGLNR